jgi:hypothetical protein
VHRRHKKPGAHSDMEGLVDGFEQLFGRKKKCYLRLVNHVNPARTVRALHALDKPTATGQQLQNAFRLSSITLRFATARIGSNDCDIILLDLIGSGYASSTGRYLVYRFTPAEGQQAHHTLFPKILQTIAKSFHRKPREDGRLIRRSS